MNPRIQVEHTVTEEATHVDLVSSQLRIAAGESLDDLGLWQESIVLRGAVQRRITTEDPANGFRPDTGRITAYRTTGGAGIRLDGGTHVGAEVSAHFDSTLVKLTCRGHDFSTAVRRARRGLAEFRVRGVSTNIAFLQAVLDDPDFDAGRINTSFVEERPQLLTARSSADRGTKILKLSGRCSRQSAARTASNGTVSARQIAPYRLVDSPTAGHKATVDGTGTRRIRALAARL